MEVQRERGAGQHAGAQPTRYRRRSGKTTMALQAWTADHRARPSTDRGLLAVHATEQEEEA